MEAVSRIKLLVGPPGCGKTTAALRHYAEILASPGSLAGPPARWISPAPVAAQEVRERLAAIAPHALLNPGVGTFSDLAGEILLSRGVRLQIIDRLQRRELLRKAITLAVAEQGLAYFGSFSPAQLVDVVNEPIADIRRMGMAPRKFAKVAAARNPRERDLAAIHSQYVGLLESGGLTDLDGLLWSAVAALQGPKRADVSGAAYRLLVFDAFSDFTSAEKCLLDTLSPASDELWITLPGEDQSVRPELFGLPNKTLESLRRTLSPSVDQFPRRKALPALAHLEQNLFGQPARLSKLAKNLAENPKGIQILAASSVQAEIDEIARRVKKLLVDESLSPEDVVIALPALGALADRVRDAFADAGIPFWVGLPRSLAADPAIRRLRALLRLREQDWPYRDLLRVVLDRAIGLEETSFAIPLLLKGRAAAERCIREAQLPAGRELLLEQIERWDDLTANPDIPELSDNQRRMQPLAALGSPILHRLDSLLAALPASATISDWIAALEELASKTLIAVPSEDRPWQSLVDGLRSVAAVDAQTGSSPRQLSLADFVVLLDEVAANISLPQQHDAVGRVRVLAAAPARFLHPRHLFLAGLDERSFTAMSRRSEFQELAPNAPDAATEELGPEMLLFYQLATSPSESLTLSYPALDAKGQPMPPSPFLVELERVFAGASLERVSQSLGQATQDSDGLFGLRDARQIAVIGATASGSDRTSALLAALAASPEYRPAGHAILAGIEAVGSRARFQTFGQFEGLLSTPAAAVLTRDFGPDHLWSASQLETYAECPFKFFSEQILRLEPTPELALESDYKRRGSVLHATLARLLAEYRADFDVPLAKGDLDSQYSENLIARFRAVLQLVADSRPGRGLDAAMRQIERRQIETWAAEFAAQYDKYRRQWGDLDSPPSARYFEARFGPGSRRNADPTDADISTEEPFALQLDGETIRLTGQIDRIDVSRIGDNVVFNVIDYKSSDRDKVDAAKIVSGQQLQLALYAMAAAELLLASQHARPLAAGFWRVSSVGFPSRTRGAAPLIFSQREGDAVHPSAEWEALKPKIVARVREIVTSIRSGDFPIYSVEKHCTNLCELKRICRIAQARSLEKFWPPRPLVAEPKRQ